MSGDWLRPRAVLTGFRFSRRRVTVGYGCWPFVLVELIAPRRRTRGFPSIGPNGVH
jgi:hypothetical protein